jgi:hypothetical protein
MTEESEKKGVTNISFSRPVRKSLKEIMEGSCDSCGGIVLVQDSTALGFEPSRYNCNCCGQAYELI